MGGRVAGLFFLIAMALLAVAGTCFGRHLSHKAAGVERLAPRELEGFRVVFVGTGGSHENHLRRGPALAVGVGSDLVLVDAGRGVAEGLRAARIPVAQPRALLLTSLLPESTVGLDDLLLTGWLAPRSTPLRVIGPPGTAALLDGLAAAHRTGIAGQADAFGLPPAGARAEVVEVAGGESFEEGALRVRAAALPGGPVPACAYRLEAQGRAVVVGGVAWGADTLVALAQGADLLVHEAFFAEPVELAIQAGADDAARLRREASFRTPLEEAGARAQRAGVRALAVVRLRPPPLFDFQATRLAGERFSGQVLVPQDGDEREP